MKTKIRKIKPVYAAPSHKPKYRVGDQIVEVTSSGKYFYLITAIDILYSAVDVISNFYYYSVLDLRTGLTTNRLAEAIDPLSKEASIDDA